LENASIARAGIPAAPGAAALDAGASRRLALLCFFATSALLKNWHEIAASWLAA
jgi:hypothetical protein